MRVISADSHIDLAWVPPELFVDGAAPALQDRMPRVVDGPEGRYWTTVAGPRRNMVMGHFCGVGALGLPYVKGAIPRYDRMAVTGLWDEGKRGILRVTDPRLRVEHQDLDGIEAEVIYGLLGLAQVLDDPEAMVEICRIYNRWIRSFTQECPDRFRVIALIPTYDVSSSIAEIQEAARLGMVGVQFTNAGFNDIESDRYLPCWNDGWLPIWDALATHNLIVHFHTTGTRSKFRVGKGSSISWDSRTDEAVARCGLQYNVLARLPGLIFSGVLDRHPTLKIVLGESGIGWIPYMLERMDVVWRELLQDIRLSAPPSELWRRHMYATFQQEAAGLRLLDVLGEDNIMWASDYPHPDSTFPNSKQVIAGTVGQLDQELADKVVYRNAARLYGLPHDPR